MWTCTHRDVPRWPTHSHTQYLENLTADSEYMMHRTADDHCCTLAFHFNLVEFVMIESWNVTFRSDSMSNLQESREIFTAYRVDPGALAKCQIAHNQKNPIPTALKEFELVHEAGIHYSDDIDWFPCIRNPRTLTDPSDFTANNLIKGFRKMYEHSLQTSERHANALTEMQDTHEEQMDALQEANDDLKQCTKEMQAAHKEEIALYTQSMDWLQTQIRNMFKKKLMQTMDKNRKTFRITFKLVPLQFIKDKMEYMNGQTKNNEQCRFNWYRNVSRFNTAIGKGNCPVWSFDEWFFNGEAITFVNVQTQDCKYLRCNMAYSLIGGALTFSCQIKYRNPQSPVWQ